MDPKIGLSEEVRDRVIGILNTTLADEHALYVKTRNYHWNVTGPQFRSLHEMLEEFYQKLAPLADDVAERARIMGGHAIGTMAEFSQQTRLSEQPGEAPEARRWSRTFLPTTSRSFAICERTSTCAATSSTTRAPPTF